MNQLSLNISPYLTYAPEEYVRHVGVADLIASCLELSTPPAFRISFIEGISRSGKTHLAIYLLDCFQKQGAYPRMLQGSELAEKITELSNLPDNELGGILIVDDAHDYLSKIAAGESGPLVNLIEKYRRLSGRIILLSSQTLSQFTFDEHIRSRLMPGSGQHISNPNDSDIGPLITAMAKQRGLKLGQRKEAFLIHRLGRSIPAIEEYLEKLTYLSKVLGKSIKFPLISDAL